jgi:hypothetical protein
VHKLFSKAEKLSRALASRSAGICACDAAQLTVRKRFGKTAQLVLQHFVESCTHVV